MEKKPHCPKSKEEPGYKSKAKQKILTATAKVTDLTNSTAKLCKSS